MEKQTLSNSETNNLIEGRFQTYQVNTDKELELFKQTIFRSTFNKLIQISVLCEEDNKIYYFKTKNTGDGKYIIIEDGEWFYG